MLLDDKRECSTLFDSGSTSTILNAGLLHLMVSLKDKMHAASSGFYVIGEGQLNFSGMIYNMSISLPDVLKAIMACVVHKN